MTEKGGLKRSRGYQNEKARIYLEPTGEDSGGEVDGGGGGRAGEKRNMSRNRILERYSDRRGGNQAVRKKRRGIESNKTKKGAKE